MKKKINWKINKISDSADVIYSFEPSGMDACFIYPPFFDEDQETYQLAIIDYSGRVILEEGYIALEDAKRRANEHAEMMYKTLISIYNEKNITF